MNTPQPGSRLGLAERLLTRAKERDGKLLFNALESERANDAEGTWFAMAARAENQRFIIRLESEIEKLKGEAK